MGINISKVREIASQNKTQETSAPVSAPVMPSGINVTKARELALNPPVPVTATRPVSALQAGLNGIVQTTKDYDFEAAGRQLNELKTREQSLEAFMNTYNSPELKDKEAWLNSLPNVTDAQKQQIRNGTATQVSDAEFRDIQQRKDSIRQAMRGEIWTAEQKKYDSLKNSADWQQYSSSGNVDMNMVKNHGTYKYMNADELNTWNYLVAKEKAGAVKPGTVKDYLSHMEEVLNYRAGQAQAEGIRNIGGENIFGSVAKPLAYGAYAFGSGVDNAVQGAKQMFYKDALPTSPMQYASSELIKDTGKVGKYAYQGLNTIGNMVPSILVSKFAGMLGASGKAAELIGSASMGATAGGNAYTQAVKEGYDKDKALAYSIGIGASEAGLQYLLGGISPLGGKSGGRLLEKIRQIDNSLKRLLLTGAVKIGSEISEEELQNYLEPALKTILFNEDYDAPTLDEILETAIVTAISTGALEGPGIVSENIKKPGNAPSQFNNVDNAATIEYHNNKGVENDVRTGSNEENSRGILGLQGRLGTDVQERAFSRGDVSVSGIVRLSPESQSILNQRGVVNVELQDSSANNAAFSSALDEARNLDTKNGWAVTPKSEQELTKNGIRTFMSANGSTGFGIAPDGDIEAVFANKAKGAPKGATKSTIPQAIANGGNKLDCYGDGLVTLYARYGFVPVAKVEFNPEFANPGWSPDKGTPYVYFMMHNGDSADTVVQKAGTYKQYLLAELDTLPTYGKEDYQAAYAYRDSLISTTPDAQDMSNVNPQQTGTVGAAMQGFETPDSLSAEAVSNLDTGAARYTKAEGEATALSKEDYDSMFKYRTQTQAQSMQFADDLLYVNENGERKFLKDFDAEAYDDILRYLTNAPAWNGVMTDAAMLIKAELQGRSINLDITEDEYISWLKVMQEHATETGRGSQAWAKWTARDNQSGQNTEIAAWNTLEKSKLDDTEKKERFRQVVLFDTQIEAAKTDEELKEIILDISHQRGVLNGLTNKQAKWLTKLAETSLNGMSSEQLKQFAYNASAAYVKDYVPVDIGKKIKTVQVLNMLSNPATAVANLVGNTTFYGLDHLCMNGASIIDMALSNVTGTRSVPFEGLGLSKETRQSIMNSVKLSIAEVTMDVDMGGNNRYDHGTERTFKANGNFTERIMSALERNMAYMLTTTDEIYKGAARGTKPKVQRLMDSGKIKTNNADYATEYAENLAKYRTFQADGKIANVLQAFHDVLNIVGIGDSGKKLGKGKKAVKVHSFGSGDLAAPFTK